MPTISADIKEALVPLLLGLADDELVIGHRHSEWTGWAPHIEEDIAFSSIAQDEIGHANLFYGLLSDVTGQSVDEIALGRKPNEYRNALVCERPNKDWAYTLARHFLYDSSERFKLEAISTSSYRPLSEVSEKLLREERYHQLHADAWFKRLASGPVEGRHQLAIALSDALPDAVGIFEKTEVDQSAVEAGLVSGSSEELLQRWLDEVVGRIEDAGIPFDLTPEDEAQDLVPTSSGEMIEGTHETKGPPPSIKRDNGKWVLSGTFPGNGGRRGRHSSEFDNLWDDLTKTYREEPSATW